MKLLTAFRMWDEDGAFLDTVDVELPEISFMTSTSSGAGILGEIDMPAKGQVPSISVSIKFQNYSAQQLGLMAGTKYLAFHGSEQYTDMATGEIKDRAVKVSMKAIPKTYGLGTLAKASEMGSSYEGEVIYLKVEHDGQVILELDKLNWICVINGVDILADVRANLG